jgi:hypothetical protein
MFRGSRKPSVYPVPRVLRRFTAGPIIHFISSAHVVKLHATCENDPSLENISLSSWQLDGDTAVMFAQGLRFNTHLVSLWWVGSPFPSCWYPFFMLICLAITNLGHAHLTR